jgi:hypothetical protein
MVLTLFGTFSAGAEEMYERTGTAKVLDGVEPFELDYDSGNMGLHALASCLKATGTVSGYYTLVGFSRSAFKFVYDSTEAYEPLRDLYPVDVLSQAARNSGHPDCHWEMNKSIDVVKSLIKGEIDNGRPVIAPFLKDDAYRGFFIIVGYDYDRHLFYLQGALGPDSAYVSVPIPEYWDGPTASPEGWARNPVFLLGEAVEELDRRGARERKSVRMGMRLFRGGALEYGTHPGEGRYMAVPGPHEAAYGLPAYDVLSWDVENAPILSESEGGQAVNFGFLWRVDSQVGQLWHDRFHGAKYVRGISRFLRFEQRMLLGEITENYEKTAVDARTLRRMFWNPVPDTLANADDVITYIEDEGAIVYWVGQVEGFAPDLASRGLETHDTPWGPVVVLDSPSKRLRAKLLVKSIASRERNSLYVMRDIAEHIGRLAPDALRQKDETGESQEGGGE